MDIYYNSNLYASQDADRANPARLAGANQASGAVHMAVVPYALKADPGNPGEALEATGDYIRLCVLPAGAIPIPGLSFVEAADPGTTLTVDVGYGDKLDALADGIVLSSGGHVAFTSGTMPADALTPAALASDETTLVATVTGADTLTAGAKLVFHIAYKMPA